jgi:hypothetical protein
MGNTLQQVQGAAAMQRLDANLAMTADRLMYSGRQEVAFLTA